ncbi:MAG: DinB family protein [Bacteroidia bacterium]
MNFSLDKSLEILTNTPKVVNAMLRGLSADWTMENEGGESWSAFDIVGHLIHGEKTDWVERTSIILKDGEPETFTPFDRFAQFEDSKGKSLEQLLNQFDALRSKNLAWIRALNLNEGDYNKIGIHPALGEATLSQLLSSWVVHDLSHIAQISRVLAHQYKDEVGPWKAYLKILDI